MNQDLITETQSNLRHCEEDGDGPPEPGLLLIFSGGQPLWSVLPLEGDALELGRDLLAGKVQDSRISRRHAIVRREGARLYARDLGSRNGTFVDGQPTSTTESRPIGRVLRIGDSLLLPVANVRWFARVQLVVQKGRVMGPLLQRVHQAIEHAARASSTLHLTGESGAGKEGAAHTFHLAGPKSTGPFIAVNCAAIPAGIAERLLFGAKRGAFSGASADADGYIQSADGGTLFLDEVAELDLAVQAKLLRVLESWEVMALGAVRPRRVDVRVCLASHTALRPQVAAGRLREDLYYRIGRPEIVIPPLRERPEELPELIDAEIKKVSAKLRAHFSFVEECLLRWWPGNVRELLVEVRAAAQEALVKGSPRIEAGHLSAVAGLAIAPATPPASLPPPPGTAGTLPAKAAAEDEVQRNELARIAQLMGAAAAPPMQVTSAPGVTKPLPAARPQSSDAEEPDAALNTEPLSRAQVLTALIESDGNISAAARLVQVHRTQLRRLLIRYNINLKKLRGLGKE